MQQKPLEGITVFQLCFTILFIAAFFFYDNVNNDVNDDDDDNDDVNTFL